MPAHPAITLHSFRTLDADPFHLNDESFLLVSSVRRTVNSGISERRVDTSGNCFLRVEADQRMEFSVSGAVLEVDGLADYYPGRNLSDRSIAFIAGDTIQHQFLDDGIFIYESAVDTDGQGVLRDIAIDISYDLHGGLDEVTVPPETVENPGGGVGVDATGYVDVPDQAPEDITDDAKADFIEAVFNGMEEVSGVTKSQLYDNSVLKVHIYDGTTLLDTYTNTAGDFWSRYEDASGDSNELAGIAVARVASTANHSLPVTDSSSVGGLTVYTGDVILLKNQTAPAENGIYTVGGGRDVSFDTWAKMRYVICDDTYNGKTYRTRNPSAGTLGTTAITWEDTDYTVDLSPNEVITFPATGSSRTITKIVVQRYTSAVTDNIIATVNLYAPLSVPAGKIVRIPISALKLSMRYPYDGTLTTGAGWADYGNTIAYVPPAAIWGGYILGGNADTHLGNDNECLDVTGYVNDGGVLVPYATARILRDGTQWTISGNTFTQNDDFDIPDAATNAVVDTTLACVIVTPCNSSGLILLKQDGNIGPFTGGTNTVTIPDTTLTLDLDA